MTQEKIYNVEEFAAVLQISVQAARHILWNRHCAYHKIAGRLKIWQSDLDDYLKRTRKPALDKVVAS
jgi:hypothetical protein